MSETKEIAFSERVPYSAIVDRPPLKLPGGARMVVWTLIAVEDWDINRPLPRTVLSPPAGSGGIPDVPNWSWHEYGNRVGFWRLKKIFDDFGIKPVLAINGVVCNSYPRIVQAAVEGGWEFMAHGYLQRSMHAVEDERAAIRDAVRIIEKATGKKPRGWVGPGLTETFNTLDYLAEEGIEYCADWVLDDQPFEIKTKTRSLVGVPYTQEVNDVAMMLIQHHKASEYRDRAIDQFDQVYEDAADSARVMAIAMHPYVMGAPHRAKYLRQVYEHMKKRKDVLFWTGEQILDWYTAARGNR
jgi:peptidoglycan/xylan/chitin deacetylase (PgdA/CDA1 family)